MRPNDSLLDLLLELQNLDRVARSGWALRGVAQAESVTEHSWHVLFLVWALGPEIPGLDVGRAVEIAVVHDLAEVRLGDLPRTASHYLPEGAKREAERAAIGELLAPLPARTRELYAEYEAGATPEARLVKACDKLQLMIKATAYEGWGAGGLAEFWDNPDNFPDNGFAPVAELFAELRRRRAG
jgi:5'-deoxynucleotidase